MQKLIFFSTPITLTPLPQAFTVMGQWKPWKEICVPSILSSKIVIFSVSRLFMLLLYHAEYGVLKRYYGITWVGEFISGPFSLKDLLFSSLDLWCSNRETKTEKEDFATGCHYDWGVYGRMLLTCAPLRKLFWSRWHCYIKSVSIWFFQKQEICYAWADECPKLK